MKRVLDVGQCAADHGSIRRLIEGHFKAEVVQAHSANDALDQLREGPFDLVLINRVLDVDGGSGLEIIEQIKSDSNLRDVAVMLITNYPEHQQRAVAAGAEAGFGKAQLHGPEAHQRLAAILA